MTEEQAKTKWCPQARVTGLDGPSGNRHVMQADGLNGADRCIASVCMAWRERRDDVHTYPDGGGTVVRVEINGYCGLAGQPS